MRHIVLILTFLALAGCIPAEIPENGEIETTPTREVWATSTPTDEPYIGDCLPEGIVPIHSGACPEDPQHADIELVSISAPERWEFPLAITYADGSYWVDLDNGAGFAGVRIHGLELVSGRCYVVQLDAYTDLNGVAYFDGLDNYAAGVYVHTSTGERIKLAQSHTFKVRDAETLTGEHPDWFWGLYSNAPQPTVVIDVGIEVQWAIAKPGNFVRIDAAYVYRTSDNGHCAGIPGV